MKLGTDYLDRLQALYPDEPMLYSFRRYLEVIAVGGFDAARAALERHIEWKAKMQPFRDEIDRQRAEIDRLRALLVETRAWAAGNDESQFTNPLYGVLEAEIGPLQ